MILIKGFIAKLAAIASDRKQKGLGINHSYPTGISGLEIVYTIGPTPLNAVLYEPVVCLILQGSKETHVGSQRFQLTAGDSLIVSHDLPVVSRVTEASPDLPYVSIVMTLEMPEVVRLCEVIEFDPKTEQQAHTVEVGKTTAELLEALQRLTDLLEKPEDQLVMLPLLKREIHYRLLQAQHGEMLRQLLRQDSHASRITRAVDQIRNNYIAELRVAELAQRVGMSLSSFHEHFKNITETTPLQYQKDLRLLEARRLLLAGKNTVAEAAFEVGYESASQFSREYSRKFGTTPSAELG